MFLTALSFCTAAFTCVAVLACSCNIHQQQPHGVSCMGDWKFARLMFTATGMLYTFMIIFITVIIVIKFIYYVLSLLFIIIIIITACRVVDQDHLPMGSSLTQQASVVISILPTGLQRCLPSVRGCLTTGSEDLGSSAAPSSAPASDPSKKLGRVSQFLGKLQLRRRVAGGIRQLAEQTAQSISKYVHPFRQTDNSISCL